MSGPGIKTVSYLLKELTAALREIQRISFEIEDSGDAFVNHQRAININSIANRASRYVEDLIHTPPVSSMMKACKDGIDATETHADIIEEIRTAWTPLTYLYKRRIDKEDPGLLDCYGLPVVLLQEVTTAELADRLEAAHKLELDEAATFINKYLEDSALDPKAHNWLIRNGYQDASYQADIFGQVIVKEHHEI